ncbi:MAG: CHAT domain-containing protein [Candidatus Heimdallarchaeota archaeon]
MSKKWINLIKDFIISGSKNIKSFEQAIQILESEYNKNEEVFNELIISVKTLYEIAEKNENDLYWQMYNSGKIVNCILRLDNLNFKVEALFLQILYMFFNVAFQTRGGRFIIDFISYKENMTIEEYKTELKIQESNIYTFVDCVIWFNDLDLLNVTRTLLIITLESIREIYIELGQEDEAIILYKNLKSWLKTKKSSNKRWREIFNIYVYTGKFEICAKTLNIEKAEKYFHIALELLDIVESKDDQIYSMQVNLVGNRGNFEKIKRDYRKSLEYFQQAHDIIELFSDKSSLRYKLWKARFCHQIGSCYFELKKHHIAEREYLTSIIQYKELLDEDNPIINEDYIRVCLDRANNYHKLNEIEHSIELLEKLEIELENIEKMKIRNIDSLKVQVLQQISKYSQELNLHDKVIEYLRRSEAIIENQEKKKTIMETRVYESYRHLGIQYREYNLGKSEKYLRKAINHFEENIPENKKSAFFEHYIATLHELGSILKFKKDYEKSLEFYIKAVKLQEIVVKKKPDSASSFAIYLNNLGNLYLIQGKHEYAKITLEYCYRIRLRLFEINTNISHDNKPDRAHVIDLCNIMNDLGALYLKLRDFYRAVPILNTALAKINSIIDNNQQTSYENEIKANILANLSRGQMNLGEFKFSLSNIEKALEIRKKLYLTHPKKFLNKLMTDYYLLGLLNSLSGDKDKAIKSCKDALEQLKNDEVRDFELTHIFEEEINNDLKEIPKISQLYEFTSKIFVSKTGKFEQRTLLAKNDKIANKMIIEKNIVDELDLLSNKKPFDWDNMIKIFSFIELSKFEYYPYFYTLKESIENKPRNLDYRKLKSELNKKSIDRKQLIDSLSNLEIKNLREYMDKISQIYEIELDCIKIITKLYYLIDKPFEDPKDINIIIDFLKNKSNESIFLITKLTDKILLFLFTQDKVLSEILDLEFLKIGWELQDKFLDYNDSIDKPKKREILHEEVSSLGTKLWNKISKEFQIELLNTEQITISTSKDMELIPFELLKANEEYLGLTKIITRIFSPLSYINRRKFGREIDNQLSSNFNALIITEPRKVGERTLVKAQEESEYIASILSDKFCKTLNIQKLEEGNVYKSSILKLFLENEFSIVHFINHGENNKIFLSNNNEFDSLDLLENFLWLGKTSVFLNICNVGKFTYYSDIILNGFIPSLLIIMNGSVIASQCRIEDINAYLLSKEFYLNLIKGMDVGDSLKHARNLQSRKWKRYDKLEWANFLLFGNPNHKLI